MGKHQLVLHSCGNNSTRIMMLFPCFSLLAFLPGILSQHVSKERNGHVNAPLNSVHVISPAPGIGSNRHAPVKSGGGHVRSPASVSSGVSTHRSNPVHAQGRLSSVICGLNSRKHVANVAFVPTTHGSASSPAHLEKPNLGVSSHFSNKKHGVRTQRSLPDHVSTKSHGVSGTSAGEAALSAHTAAKAPAFTQQQPYHNASPGSAQGYAGHVQAPRVQAHAAAETVVHGRQAQAAKGGVVGASDNIATY